MADSRTSSDDAFGRRHLSAQAGVEPGGIVERAGERFEGRLGPVMVVLTSQQSDVEAEAAVGRERLQQVRDHLAAQSADGRTTERQIDGRPATAAEIDRDLCQGFVERDDSIAETTNRAPLAERLVERLAETDADVFGGVMLV